VDGSYIAQLGVPDMKTPIANAMYYPKRGSVNVESLDFTKYQLSTLTDPLFG
ncbi:1-deoxy-D-xylulose-5-phosphate reductoisomerase, partial [Francisella tularensis]|nr:1-deoxy-D-xylulose-5-phosphate reductoisomerase [Francisella tularensis]